MSQSAKPVVFILNDQPIAKVCSSGKLEPTHVPKVRIEQIDNRSDLGKQARIEKKFGRHNPGDANPGIAGG